MMELFIAFQHGASMSPYAAQISIFKRIGAKTVSDIDFLETLIDSFYI